MVAAVRGIRVTAGADAEARASPELAEGHHQGFFQQAPLVEVFQQGAEAGVEFGAVQVAQWAEVGGMGVPGVDGGVAIGHSGPVHLHEAGPGFEKAPG